MIYSSLSCSLPVDSMPTYYLVLLLNIQLKTAAAIYLETPEAQVSKQLLMVWLVCKYFFREATLCMETYEPQTDVLLF